MKVPPGDSGTVIEVRVFNRRGIEKDERSLAIERAEIEFLAKDRDDERLILENSFTGLIKQKVINQVVSKGNKKVKSGQKVNAEILEDLNFIDLRNILFKDNKTQDSVSYLNKNFDTNLKSLEERFQNKVEKLQKGDELPPGVMKMVKIFVAVKRKLQPGDKMAGRHGNKGVISKIVPIEDMPYIEDGTHVDILLNPLGVPSSRKGIAQHPPHLQSDDRSLARKGPAYGWQSRPYL